MDRLKHKVHQAYVAAAEAVLPPRSTSAFKEKGVLTPEEFVQAGDFLVRACPTWAWEAGDPKKARSYLPADKQYLITRNVPCLQRAAAVEEYGEREEVEVEAGAEGGGEGWVTASAAPRPAAASTNEDGFEEVPSISAEGGDASGAAGGAGEEAEQGGGQGTEEAQLEEDVPDISALDLEDEEPDLAALPPAAAAETPAADVLRTRTYDLLISYNKFYQVPQFWLVGYDEERRPLTPAQVLEDVSAEHARKTVTIEEHPHGGSAVRVASIHPCRHAEVMRKLAGVVAAEQDFAVEHYLVLFLKFISSVVPTIQYDYTMTAGGS